MGLFSRKKAEPEQKKGIQPLPKARHEVWNDGSHLYLLDHLNHNRHRIDFDMSLVTDKVRALVMCAPFNACADKLGAMASRGRFYVTDMDGNEKNGREYNEIRNLLMHPNPLQPWTGFLKQVELSLTAFGFCPIVYVRATENSIPLAMYVIPADCFHLEGTGRVFRQYDKQEMIRRAYITWSGRDLLLDDYEYSVVFNSGIRYGEYDGEEIRFSTPSDSLSKVVTNQVAAMVADNTLLVNGGPKGVLYSDSQDDLGNNPVGADEEKEIKDKFRDSYGLVGKEYPIMVSRYRLGWLPLDYDRTQLATDKVDERCIEQICNAYGLNVNLFINAKYDNQESAKRATYQDVVIPDVEKIQQVLTEAICPEGIKITIDLSGVECLQADRQKEANTLKTASEALIALAQAGKISDEELRLELSRYIDIDPSKKISNE